jgi:antitoxin MazE
MQVTIRPFGNSRGVIIPKLLLAQVGLQESAEIEVHNGTLVLRKPQPQVREGWATAAQSIAAAGEDALVLGDESLTDEEDWQW